MAGVGASIGRKIAQLLALAIVVPALLTGSPHPVANDAPASHSAELDARDSLTRSIAALLAAGDIDSLNALSTEFRSSEVRTSSGVWKLTLFHNAIDRAARDADGDAVASAHLLRTLQTWRARDPDNPSAVIAQTVALKAMILPAMQAARPLPVSFGGDMSGLAALTQLRDDLDAACRELAADPHFYVVRTQLGFAVGEPVARLAALVDHGLIYKPTYTQLYFTALDTVLAHDGYAAADFDILARRSQGGEVGEEAAGMYARLVWHSVNEGGPGIVLARAVDWDRMRLGIADVIGRYPDPWNVNNFAYLACLAGDRATTAGLFEAIGDTPILDAWRSLAVYDRCREWALGG